MCFSKDGHFCDLIACEEAGKLCRCLIKGYAPQCCACFLLDLLLISIRTWTDNKSSYCCQSTLHYKSGDINLGIRSNSWHVASHACRPSAKGRDAQSSHASRFSPCTMTGRTLHTDCSEKDCSCSLLAAAHWKHSHFQAACSWT